MNGKKWCMIVSVFLINVFVVSGQLCAMDHVSINNSDEKNKKRDSFSSSDIEDFANEKYRSRSKRDETRIAIPKTPSSTSTSPEKSPGDSPDKSPERNNSKHNSPVIPHLSLPNNNTGTLSLQEKLDSQEKSSTQRKSGTQKKFGPQKFNLLSNPKKVGASSSGDSFSSGSKTVPKDTDHLVEMVKAYSINIKNKNDNKRSGLRRREIIDQDNIDSASEVKVSSRKTYTRDQVVEILKLYDERKAQESPGGQQSSSRERDGQLSNRLHEYGIKNGVKLKHLPHYGEMLQNIDVTSDIIEEYFYKRHNVEPDKAKPYVQKNMQKMKEKDPEKYQEIVFAILQAIVDGQDDTIQPDTSLVSAHVDCLHKEIDDKKGSLFWSNVGLVIAVLINVGQAVGNIYSGIQSGNDNTCNCNITLS